MLSRKENSSDHISDPMTPPLETFQRVPDEGSYSSEEPLTVNQKHSLSLPPLTIDLSLGRDPAAAATAPHCTSECKVPATTRFADPSAAPKLASSKLSAGHEACLPCPTDFNDHLSLQLAILPQEDTAVAASAVAAATASRCAVAAPMNADVREPDMPMVHRPRP